MINVPWLANRRSINLPGVSALPPAWYIGNRSFRCSQECRCPRAASVSSDIYTLKIPPHFPSARRHRRSDWHTQTDQHLQTFNWRCRGAGGCSMVQEGRRMAQREGCWPGVEEGGTSSGTHATQPLTANIALTVWNLTVDNPTTPCCNKYDRPGINRSSLLLDQCACHSRHTVLGQQGSSGGLRSVYKTDSPWTLVRIQLEELY